jgi:hypothetical protein
MLLPYLSKMGHADKEYVFCLSKQFEMKQCWSVVEKALREGHQVVAIRTTLLPSSSSQTTLGFPK